MCDSNGLNFIDVEPGRFSMGEANTIPDDQKIHEHTLRGRTYQTINIDHPKGYLELDSMYVPQWPWNGHEQETVPMDVFSSMPIEAEQRPLTRLGGAFIHPDGHYDKKPVHNVIISYPFAITEYPVTADQYREFDPSNTGEGLDCKLVWNRG